MPFGLREGFQVGAGRWGAVAAALVGMSALNAPAAHAVDTGIAVTGITVNEGKPIVIGTAKVVEPSIRYDVHLPAGYSTADWSRWDERVFLYRGNDPRKAFRTSGGDAMMRSMVTCYEESAKKARCEGTLHIEANVKWGEVNANADAGIWKVGVELLLWKPSGGVKADEYERRALTVSVRRAAKTTIAATPDTVGKGKKVTVTGKLTRANWDTRKTGAYGARGVALQFRAVDATAFKTVRTVRTTSAGALSTTVDASVDGFYRWVYAGDTVTAAATSPAAYVDVR
ncbi:hypothetical protein [Streptomyces acidiscabies]|uniref:hypothetical protein n=1 Tax=Streptomyces acidiscabies TaxID=42234 RepID=UPI0038F6E865